MIIALHSNARRTAPGAANLAAANHRLITARRTLQLTLAAVWLVDAALQYQPFMFTKVFVTGTLAPASYGNPAVVAAPMTWVLNVFAGHVVVFNALFATLQLAIAAGLIWRRTVKAALAVSVAWAVGVWWFGEGLGGVLIGTSPLMGAPGAVILYALVAVMVWPRDDTGDLGSVSDHGALGRTGAQLVWPVLWGALAYLFLLPANRGPASIGLALACDLVAVSIFVPRFARAGTATAALIGVVIWVSQGFGTIFTGRSTDPNSGLLLILAAVAFWPLAQPAGPAATVGPIRATGRPLHSATASQRPANARRRERSIGWLAALALIATGCAAAQGPVQRASDGQTMGTNMPAGMVMPGGAHMTSGSTKSPASPAVARSQEDGPSQSAQMVCGPEIRRDVAISLSLSTEPSPTSTWDQHLYTCTYHLPAGRLIIAVKELGNVPAAHAYFDQERQHFAPTRPIVGLASLGLPAYESSSGTVMFLKDDKTLEVDASSMPARIGPDRLSRSDFAYQIATDILGCWSGN